MSNDESHVTFKKVLGDIAPIGQVKQLHTDNGGEYTSKDFLSVLLARGIKHITTAPHSPYQNGKAERF